MFSDRWKRNEERLQAVLWGKIILMMRQVSPF